MNSVSEIKKKLKLLFSILIAIAVGGILAPQTALASNIATLSGYAWSSNIGWISFKGPGYGVLINYTSPSISSLSGYAWSSNIGWISFNETAGCPEVGCTTQPKLNTSSGAVSGWAKAIAADGNGWDGWIKLTGWWSPSVSFSATAASGYSWGSDVVGWVSWKGPGYGVLINYTPPSISSFTASPNPIIRGQSSSLTWSSTHANSCISAGGFSTGGATSNLIGVSVTPSVTTSYGLICAGIQGDSINKYVTVTVIQPTATITASPTRVVRSGGTATITWNSTNVTSCSVSGPGLSSTALSGSQLVTVNSQSVYTISCTTLGVPVSASTVVNVVPIFQQY